MSRPPIPPRGTGGSAFPTAQPATITRIRKSVAPAARPKRSEIASSSARECAFRTSRSRRNNTTAAFRISATVKLIIKTKVRAAAVALEKSGSGMAHAAM